jgi:hypothetical protein
MKNFQLIVFFLCLCLFIGCKDKEAAVSTKSDRIIKNWKLTGAEFENEVKVNTTFGIITVKEFYIFLEDCNKDDIYEFKSDKTLIVYDVKTSSDKKCSSSDPDIRGKGNWTFNSTETQLTFNYGTTTVQAEVLEFTDTSIKLKANASDFSDLLPNSISVPAGAKTIITYTAQ